MEWHHCVDKFICRIFLCLEGADSANWHGFSASTGPEFLASAGLASGEIDLALAAMALCEAASSAAAAVASAVTSAVVTSTLAVAFWTEAALVKNWSIIDWKSTILEGHINFKMQIWLLLNLLINTNMILSLFNCARPNSEAISTKCLKKFDAFSPLDGKAQKNPDIYWTSW